MCLSVGKLDDGTEVWCRDCWQCRKARVDDWVGRCIAESKVSAETYCVTLTYADIEENGAATAVLEYRHIQLFLKRLRKAGHKVRYLVAGEYGSRKGRAHWHVVLFFENKGPEVVQHGEPRAEKQIVLARTRWDLEGQRLDDPEARISYEYWSHVREDGSQVSRGFTYWERATPEAFGYVAKYVLKQLDQEVSEKSLMMSKMPPLGDGYFYGIAVDYVEAALLPKSAHYWFPDIRNKKAKPRKYYMGGRTQEIFVERVVAKWREKYGEEPPLTEWMAKVADREARREAPVSETFEPARYKKSQGRERRGVEPREAGDVVEIRPNVWVYKDNGRGVDARRFNLVYGLGLSDDVDVEVYAPALIVVKSSNWKEATWHGKEEITVQADQGQALENVLLRVGVNKRLARLAASKVISESRKPPRAKPYWETSAAL